MGLYVGGLNGAILRMKGIGWETANFALVLIIGYILSIEKKKSKSIQILFIIAIINIKVRMVCVSLCIWI